MKDFSNWVHCFGEENAAVDHLGTNGIEPIFEADMFFGGIDHVGLFFWFSSWITF